MLEYAFVSASSPVPLCVRPVEPSPLMEAMVLSGEPVSPPRAMLVTGLNELPPEVWPASDPANTHANVHFIPLLSAQQCVPQMKRMKSFPLKLYWTLSNNFFLNMTDDV